MERKFYKLENFFFFRFDSLIHSFSWSNDHHHMVLLNGKVHCFFFLVLFQSKGDHHQITDYFCCWWWWWFMNVDNNKKHFEWKNLQQEQEKKTQKTDGDCHHQTIINVHQSKINWTAINSIIKIFTHTHIQTRKDTIY